MLSRLYHTKSLYANAHQYAVLNGDGLTLLDAKQRVQKHAMFLISHFPKEQDINWQNTSLTKWLRSQNEVCPFGLWKQNNGTAYIFHSSPRIWSKGQRMQQIGGVMQQLEEYLHLLQSQARSRART